MFLIFCLLSTLSLRGERASSTATVLFGVDASSNDTTRQANLIRELDDSVECSSLGIANEVVKMFADRL